LIRLQGREWGPVFLTKITAAVSVPFKKSKSNNKVPFRGPELEDPRPSWVIQREGGHKPLSSWLGLNCSNGPDCRNSTTRTTKRRGLNLKKCRSCQTHRFGVGGHRTVLETTGRKTFFFKSKTSLITFLFLRIIY